MRGRAEKERKEKKQVVMTPTDMEVVVVDDEGSSDSKPRYTLQPVRIRNEDILFCIDVDPESLVDMKLAGPSGRPFTRLDAIKQGILLFVNAKLTINPDHRFAFASLSNSASWLRKEFSSEVESAMAAVRGLSATSSCDQADLTSLFRVASHEAKKSHTLNRIFRVILIYCRSAMPPKHTWPVNRKLFTLDVIYLHDKPSPQNCPQQVYDALVDALEHVSEYEGYILESGQGLARTLFRYMCMLLTHPQQRCAQEDLGIPQPLVKKVYAPESMSSDDIIPISIQ